MPTDERTSLEALYAQHYLGLVRLALHLVDDPETAEDVVHDVFVGARESALGADPLRYLQTAVVNRSRSALRRRRVVRAFLGTARVTTHGEPADEPALRADDRRTLLAAVSSLPPRQREVIVLRYYEDLRVAEIADLLGLRPGAVSTALTHALRTLASATATTTGRTDD